MIIKKDSILGYDYSFEFDFKVDIVSYCKHLSSVHGFKKISFFDKKWRINDINLIVKIKSRFPEAVIEDNMLIDYQLAEYLSTQSILDRENSNRIKLAKESSLEIKNVKGTLYPYQKVGVEFFIANNGTAINSDPMGVGKSLQALAYAAHSELKKVLIVCPASVKYNWENEVRKFTDLESFVINGNASEKQLEKGYESSTFLIINYDILKKFFGFICLCKWDLLVLDECHMIKNNSAQRTKVVKKIARVMPRRILLSGTPFLSRPVELFNSLYLVDPKTWNNFYSYGKRYCDAFHDRYGWNDRGASNIEELQERISPYFIRRRKEDILPDLPPKRYISYPVELDKKTQKEYDMAEKEFGRFLVEVKKKTLKETQKTLQAEKLAKLGALRYLTSMGKIEVAKEIIENIIDSGEKVLVFSCYNKPLELLQEHFGDKTLMLTGSVESKKRNEMVNDFQTNENRKIFLGGIKSAGVGINLTAASNVLFLDFSWVPADHAQAADRAHRIGTKASHVTIYQLYSKGTVDEFMHKLLEKKQLLFDCLIDGKLRETAVRGNYASSIISTIEKRQDPSRK